MKMGHFFGSFLRKLNAKLLLRDAAALKWHLIESNYYSLIGVSVILFASLSYIHLLNVTIIVLGFLTAISLFACYAFSINDQPNFALISAITTFALAVLTDLVAPGRKYLIDVFLNGGLGLSISLSFVIFLLKIARKTGT
jgi:hypothetical protein